LADAEAEDAIAMREKKKNETDMALSSLSSACVFLSMENRRADRIT
jgi:hypothetical protein